MSASKQTDAANDIEESNNVLRGFEESESSRPHLELK